MDLPTTLLLGALVLAGIGLFYRAWARGMAFGERLEERERAQSTARDADEDPPVDS